MIGSLPMRCGLVETHGSASLHLNISHLTEYPAATIYFQYIQNLFIGIRKPFAFSYIMHECPFMQLPKTAFQTQP